MPKENNENLKKGDASGMENTDELSCNMEKNLAVDGINMDIKTDGKHLEPSAKLNQETSNASQVVKPCGLINSGMVVGKDALYIYGGMMEVKDREITLDDLYSLNFSKLDEWKCNIPASEPEWQESSEDDDEDEGEGEGEDESGGDTEADETDGDDTEARNNGAGPIKVKDTVALIRGEEKKLRRKEKHARIEQIRASLGLSDSQRTYDTAFL